MAKKLTATPVGDAVYPHLTVGKPDTKFTAEGVYHVKLTRPNDEWTQNLVAEIDAAAQSALAEAKKEYAGKKPEKGKKPPKLSLCDDMPYTQDEDGTVTFNFKMKAQGKDKDGKTFTLAPTIVDAKGKPVKGAKIGGGSKLRVSFALESFYQPKLGAGVTLRLYGVQIIDLVEYGGRSAASLGFDEVEGGFDGSEFEAGADESDETPAATDDGDEFDGDETASDDDNDDF